VKDTSKHFQDVLDNPKRQYFTPGGSKHVGKILNEDPRKCRLKNKNVPRVPKVGTSYRASFEPVLHIHCLAALDLGADVEQPFDSHRPEPPDRAVHEEVDGLDIGEQHGRRFVFLRHTHRPQSRHIPFVQAGAETSDTGAEAVKPDPRCSWEGHSGLGGCRRRG